MARSGLVGTLLSGYESLRDWQQTLYTDLHRHPELSHQEHRTAGVVSEELRGLSCAAGTEVQVHTGVGGTGVVAVLQRGAGPAVLLRADMDALPVAEQSGLRYASEATATDTAGRTVPVMHACGHDVHVACLLAAVRLFAEADSGWAGTVVAVFQPGEESADGARGMVADGLAQLIPVPDVALGQHVLARPAGTVGPRSGPFLSQADSVRITLYGRGSHGSMPHLSVDPAVLAAMVVVRLQTVVSREVPPGEFAVLTVGHLAVGAKSNIIDDHAVLELNIRTYDPAIRELLLAAIHRIAIAESAASGSPRDPEIEVYDSYPLTCNDTVVTARVAEAFTAYFGENSVDYGRQTASEDFSAIPDALGIPYLYWGFGGTDPEQYRRAEERGTVSSDIPANHSPAFAPVLQPTLRTGTEALVSAALAWLAAD